jgi:hypothetical protein
LTYSFDGFRKGKIMKQALIVLLAVVLWAPAVVPATGDDPAAPVRQFIDGFNTGDTKTAFAAYATGPITIVDEFAPHIWSGPNAAHEWADGYDKHAQATGVTDGKVTYGKPTRIERSAEVAYVVIPTVYLYKENGKAIKEEGQVTAVLNRESGAWKIRGWTWTGVKPHSAQ